MSGGGLIGLSATLDDITRLQAQQLAAGGGDVDGEDAYAVSAYAVLDSLLGSVQSWQEILNAEERYAAASALIRQVDAAGVISVAELAASGENVDECSTVSQR